MNMLTELMIDPAGVGPALAGLDNAAPPGDAPGVRQRFVLPIALPEEREPEPGPSIECLDGSAFLRIHDPRFFAPGRDAFCRALLESAVTPEAFRRAEICLESATCRLEFAPGRLDRAQVAQHASAAIRAATPALHRQGHDHWPRRGEPGWTMVCAFATSAGSRPSIWKMGSAGPGWLRLRYLGRFGRRLAHRTASILKMWPGIGASDCAATPSGYEFVVQFDPHTLAAADVVLAAEAALRVARNCGNRTTRSKADQIRLSSDELSNGIPWDLLVAGGSLLLAVLGLVLPGIPAVPFIVLSGHALCRAYPQLQPWLHSLPGIGQLLSGSATSEGKWTDPNFVGKCLLSGALVAALLLIVHPPLPLVLACEIGVAFFSVQ